MGALRILIADDHDVVRRGLRSLVESRPEWKVCGEAVDGRDAVNKTEELKPDVILLDITMPHLNGLEAARIIRKQVPKTEIILVSQHESSQVHKAAMDAGVRAFVAKSQVARDLVTALNAISPRNGDGNSATEDVPRPSSSPKPYLVAKETVPSKKNIPVWLSGAGEMRRLIREYDWSQTPLGTIENWPQALKTSVSLILDSQHPMWLGWGREMVFLYNEPYIQVLSLAKHPWALGRPASEVWAEIWDICGPLSDKVFEKGEASYLDDVRLFMNRGDFLEETYYSFSYSPIRDESGKVAGLFCPSAEVSPKVINARRLHTLSELSGSVLMQGEVSTACASACAVLGKNPDDVPFAELYLINPEGDRAILEQSCGLPKGIRNLSPEMVSLRDSTDRSIFPISAVAESSKLQQVSLESIKGFPLGPAQQELTQAVVLPLTSRGEDRPLGVLVAGVNPTRKLDAEYRTFYELIAAQIAKGIADARAFEQERKRAEALAELDRAKTIFFSNVSHEFRTPLSLMLGPVEELLSTKGSLEESDREQLQIVQRNSLRMLKLVNSLLDFSQIEAGRVQALYQPTDLAAFTVELGSMFRSAMDRAGLRFVVHCPRLPEPVYVDRDMWEKIVLNLLSNALKFTFEGDVSVTLEQQGRSVELTVEDTGIGIPPHELPRLFERFHRVEGSHGRSHEGTGIGLALLQELVKLHGGFVHVKSAPGKGSIFTVSIPMGTAHLSADRVGGVRTRNSSALRADTYVEEALRWLPQESMASPEVIPDVIAGVPPSDVEPLIGAGHQLILLADDNTDMREYVRRLLAQYYRVHAVSNGEEAIRAIRELKPDLVLTDIMMPVIDGFGVLRAARENPETKSRPVILLSARAGEESRVEGLQAGADDYLVKPFTARELLARVGAHLKMSRIRQEAAELERQLRAEADLERGRLREVFRRAPASIAMLSGPDFRIEFVNEAAALASGRSVDELQGRPILDAMPELRNAGFPGVLRKVFEKGEAFVGQEWRILMDRGEGNIAETYFNLVFQPVRDVSGETVSILIHAVEVTDQVIARTKLEERVQERTADLQQAEESLRALSGRLLQIQDEERRRIARELHDSAGQLLAALGMNLIPLQSKVEKLGPDAIRVANESVALVDELTKELRTISHLLHPPMLDEAGLDLALQWFVEGFGERSKISVQFERSPELGRLPREIETTVFRIVQESLTNIHRHSGSSTALVRITRKGNEVRVEVQDQGKGIPAHLESDAGAIVRPGVGIQGMKERVRQLKGHFAIRSSKEGTTIVVRLPLQDPPTRTPAQAPARA